MISSKFFDHDKQIPFYQEFIKTSR